MFGNGFEFRHGPMDGDYRAVGLDSHGLPPLYVKVLVHEDPPGFFGSWEGAVPSVREIEYELTEVFDSDNNRVWVGYVLSGDPLTERDFLQ